MEAGASASRDESPQPGNAQVTIGWGGACEATSSLGTRQPTYLTKHARRAVRNIIQLSAHLPSIPPPFILCEVLPIRTLALATQPEAFHHGFPRGLRHGKHQRAGAQVRVLHRHGTLPVPT